MKCYIVFAIWNYKIYVGALLEVIVFIEDLKYYRCAGDEATDVVAQHE